MSSEIGKTTETRSATILDRNVNLVCKKLFKVYKQGNLEVVALKGVDLTVYAGELIVIMGPSGSGKTTLLNIISGMEEPTAGSVYIKDYELTKLNDRGLQKVLQNDVAMIFQFFNLIPSLTARGNIDLPMIIAGKDEDYRKKKIDYLLEKVELKDRAHHRPHVLSGGEKQRIAIAMALSNDPTIILADEPTGNIDSISAEKIMKIFRKFVEDNPDKSIIIVTHDPNFRKIADRTFVIKDGQFLRELGKLKKEEIEGKSSDNSDNDLAKIYQVTNGGDEVAKILDPRQHIIDYEKIKYCPTCHSDNIIKKYDMEGPFKIVNSYMVTKATIFCKKCLAMNYQDASIYSIKKDLTKH